MKRRLIIAGVVLLLLAGITTILWHAFDRPSPRPISAIAEELREVVPFGWNVRATDAAIVIQSERQMIFFSSVSALPFLPEGWSEEDYLREFGETRKYVLTLTFVPRLSPAGFGRLREARRPHEETLERGTTSKTVYGEAVEGRHEHRDPTYYTDDYSVFDDCLPEDDLIEIHPPDAAAEVEELLASLEEVLTKY